MDNKDVAEYKEKLDKIFDGKEYMCVYGTNKKDMVLNVNASGSFYLQAIEDSIFGYIDGTETKYEKLSKRIIILSLMEHIRHIILEHKEKGEYGK